MAKIEKIEFQCIPFQLSEPLFEEFVLPHLWRGSRGPQPKISLFKTFNYILYVLYTGCQWRALQHVIEKDAQGKPLVHFSTIYKRFRTWQINGCLESIFCGVLYELMRTGKLDLSMLHGDGTNTVAKKGGDGVGYSGHKHQKGEKLIAISDNRGNILAPAVVAPVNESDMKLLPKALSVLKRICRAAGFELPKGTLLNLDAGFDSRYNRKHIYNAGLKPNIRPNKRNRKKARTGRSAFFDARAFTRRFIIERSFAWQDKFRRVVIRYERLQARFFAFQLLAFIMINLRNLRL